jgi:GT2 family glycosyltransferase
MPPPSHISVVIPVYNGARTLSRVLDALAQANPAPYEIIVVDDGSGDDSAALAEQAGCRVVRLEKNVGAAAAKNCGAAMAQGDILFFTDADILVPADTCAQLTEAFAETPTDGVVGLLDENIPHSDFASQFKNLWMNFTYARFVGTTRIGLFYTSCAAIRRARFLELGGFDENYRGASIAEDTEFGQRAWAAGATLRLAPRLRVIHLKAYSLTGVLLEDCRRARALMLMRLRKWGQPFFTSVPRFYQLAVLVLYLTLLGATTLLLRRILALEIGFWNLGFVLFGLVIFYCLNAPLLLFLARVRGLRLAAQASLFLPVDALMVGIGILLALFDFARGRRY